MKLDRYTIQKKINSKWHKDLIVRTETLKLLGENIEKLLDTELGKDFLDMTPKAQAMKVKINNWGCIKQMASTRERKQLKYNGNLWNGRKY